ncbi:MAG: PAS domain-containing protein [Bacteroidetes bacterium]|nr:PAS domain-containing protein [Bacteroidota bacterium]
MLVCALALAAFSSPPSHVDSDDWFSVYDVRIDHNLDNVPDLLGRSVRVRGRISLLSKGIVSDDVVAVVQDATAGVLVGRIASLGFAVGDSVAVTGEIRRLGNDILLAATKAYRVDSTSVLPIAELIPEKTIDLRPWYGKRVEATGYVVRMVNEQYGASVVLSRKGGLLVVRSPVPVTDASFPKIAPGDFVTVDGVLSAEQSDEAPWPRMIISSASHITPSIPIRSFFGWGLVVAAVVTALLAYLLLSFAVNRIRGFRERPYRAVFAQSGTPMILCSTNLKVIDANHEAARLLRKSSAQLTLRRLPQLFAVDPSSDIASIVADLPKGSKVTIEAGVPDGSHEGVALDITLSRAKLGKREYVLAVMHDVTRHADSVNQFRHFHEELLDGMPVEVSVLSPAGKYLYANGFGYGDETTRAWLIGKTDLELCQRLDYPQDVALRRRAHRRRASITKETIQFEEVVSVRGIERHILRTYQPVFEPNSSDVAAVASYGLDVTELISSRKQLDEARVAIDKAGRLKETFLQNINHEFRTPITGIIGFAEILEAEVPDEHREFVNLIERNGRRLMNTLNAVLDLAGLNNNEFDLNLQVLNIVDEVRQIIDTSKEMAEEKGLFLRLEAARTEVLGRVDQVCTTRVVQNLIDNAVKFTEAGGIIVEVDADDKFINIRVLDTGVGIDPEFVPHLFDDFSRDHQDGNGGFEGAGIGLGISQRLTELMRGEISVQSQPGEGSMFTVSLPRAFPARGRFDKGKPRLLVVDDSSDVKTMVNYVLDEHFAIDVATNFDDMDLLLLKRKYDGILMDLGIAKLPIVLEAATKIRESYDEIELPLIAVDEKLDRSRKTAVLDGPFTHYLAKPFKKGDLIGLMSSIISDLLYSGRAIGKVKEGDAADETDMGS